MTTRYRTALRLLALAGVALAATAASAQTGKLSGRVLDANGEPLIAASVLVVGTTYGAATDLDGVYNVLRIPPGTVDVRVSSIGYQTQVLEGVQIRSNTTTELDVTLQDEVVAGEEVVVTAEQPVVDITQTSTVATISRDEIAALPVQELADVVNLQAGVVDGHFRGGRLGEVQFQVDGVSVNNPYDNTSTLTLDRSVLQEVQVISGTFDAEYGQALSGVVNAVLRSGDPGRYEASFEFFGGDFLSPGNDSTEVRTSIAGRDSVATVPFAPYISDIDPLARQNFQASISGPVPLVPGTTFLLNGQRFVNNGRFMAERRFLPTDSSDFERNVFNPTGDGAVVPLGYDRRWSFLGKVSNTLVPNVRLDYQFIGAVRDRKGTDYAYRFNPDGAGTQDEFSLVHGLGVLHTLSNNVFYELNLRQNVFDFADYRFESLGTLPETGTRVPLPADSPYAVAGRPIGSQNFEDGAIVQGYDLGRFVQRTNSYVAKGAVTAQVTNVHLVKAGFEVQTSDVEFGEPGAVQALIIDGRQQLGVLRDTLGAQVIDFQPVQGAAFVQDRIEWGDLRVRAGLRLEYFDANATVPSDLGQPGQRHPRRPRVEAASTRRPRWVLAPRLGVSFPFLDRASLFFSYGHFYQLPGPGDVLQQRRLHGPTGPAAGQRVLSRRARQSRPRSRVHDPIRVRVQEPSHERPRPRCEPVLQGHPGPAGHRVYPDLHGRPVRSVDERRLRQRPRVHDLRRSAGARALVDDLGLLVPDRVRQRVRPARDVQPRRLGRRPVAARDAVRLGPAPHAERDGHRVPARQLQRDRHPADGLGPAVHAVAGHGLRGQPGEQLGPQGPVGRRGPAGRGRR